MNQHPDPDQATVVVDESWPASPVELMMGSDRARTQAKAAEAARLVCAAQARRRAAQIDPPAVEQAPPPTIRSGVNQTGCRP